MSDNLIPLGSNPERDKEIRRMGQKAQAEKKRQRRTLREDLIALLSKDYEDNQTFQDAMITAILAQAIHGNVKAATFVRDTIGEKPVEKVENTISSENKKAVDDFLKEVKNGKSKDT